MQIMLLDETRFDSFAINHPRHNYYQTSNYGRLMTKNGHNAYYLGLVDEYGEVKAATLMIVKSDQKERKRMGYCPRGFLIDWEDEELVKTFTELLKEFLSKKGFTYIKIDPMVIYKEHNLDGTEKQNGIYNLDFTKKLQSLGYIHMGYNNAFEASKPRWNSLIFMNNDITGLYNSISKDARNKIYDASKRGNRIYKGSEKDITLLFTLINSNIPPIEYYYDYYNFYGNDKFEIYFNKLEPIEYVNESKMAYEEEEEINHRLTNQLQDMYIADKSDIINKKLQSDEILAKYKRNMLEASRLFQQYPNGIVTAAVAVIKYGKTITFFASGVNEQFKGENPEYLLKWQLIQEFAKQGYTIVNLGGLTSNLKLDYNSTVKSELGNKIVEYVGEFDLVINKKAYYTGTKLNPIFNWLNTPI